MKRAIYVLLTIIGIVLPILYSVYRDNEVANLDHIKATCERRTNAQCLIWAAMDTKKTKAIKELLKAGTHTEVKDKYGWTALMRATAAGHTEAIRELLKAGANLEARSDVHYETALMKATTHRQIGAIKELLKAGADIEARDNEGKTAFDMWQRHQKDHPDFQEISELLKP